MELKSGKFGRLQKLWSTEKVFDFLKNFPEKILNLLPIKLQKQEPSPSDINACMSRLLLRVMTSSYVMRILEITEILGVNFGYYCFLVIQLAFVLISMHNQYD